MLAIFSLFLDTVSSPNKIKPQFKEKFPMECLSLVSLFRIPSSMEPPSSSSGPLRELAIRSDRSYSCLGNYNALDASLDDFDQKDKVLFPSIILESFYI